MTGKAGAGVRMSLAYRLGRMATRVAVSSYVRLSVEGLENVPGRGGAILAANHQSFLDPLVVGAWIRRQVTFLARDSLFRVFLLGPLLRGVGTIPVRRGSADRSALERCGSVVRKGGLVCLFPEGSRSPDGAVRPLRRGLLVVARLCRGSSPEGAGGGVPVVPVGIHGSHRLWPRHRRLPRPGRVVVRYGPPLDSEELFRPGGLERLRRAIASLAGAPLAPGGEFLPGAEGKEMEPETEKEAERIPTACKSRPSRSST